MSQLPRLADFLPLGLPGGNMHTTTVQPAGGLRRRAIVVRRTFAVLCNFINEYSAATGCKSATAACELAGLFRAIHDHLAQTADRCLLAPNVCWAGSTHDLASPCGGYQITPSSLAAYFEQRGRGERRPAEHIECGTEARWHAAYPVADDVIVFAPDQLVRLIEASGQRVPDFLLHDPAPAEVPPPAPAAGAGRKRAAHQAAPAPAQWAHLPPAFAAQCAAYAKFWENWKPGQRPPLQKTVSAFIAERMGLVGPTRKTDEMANVIRPPEAQTERGPRQLIR
ncbi:hypothetical protein [Azotobacter chroococcum]|uniref:Uncharacterized protein n=1 Tax=Azotobacter chroococcum TaxID=353 RepID=A0AAP9YFV8_9GAMM|nr:hypothetical protein [Azotobacter chroococcum]QQE88534.1 hypothetical protein GKQ51_20250 [Azotobacter chroococcum]